MHEHIIFGYPGDEFDRTSTWTREGCIEVAVERMRGLLDHGIRTFVDPCPIECGRDPEMMAEISQRSGMQIVCATGFYYADVGIPYYWRLRTEDEIYELFMTEINTGIGSTGIKPGIVKIASSSPPTDLERKVITAAARAAKESGLTVVSHCEHSNGSEIQQEILSTAGVDLARCMIGHQDEAEKVQQLIEIAERGSFVGVDRVGYEILSPDDHRVELITGMLDGGFAQSLCISMDHLCTLRSARLPFRVPKELEPFLDQALPFFYDQLYRRPHTYLFTDFWPRLESAGVARATFDAILTDNPRRLFGG
jgi:phosphotriesterase-related protein